MPSRIKRARFRLELAIAALFCASVYTLGGTVQHCEYVFQGSSIYVYDIDNGFALVKTLPISTGGNPRGAVASARTGMLYVSFGPDWGPGGLLLKYDLTKEQEVWTKPYPFGIDSMSISPDGTTLYMPTGELATGGIWEIIDAATGDVTGSIDTGGSGPHNTVVSASGRHVYMGLRDTNFLVEADTASRKIVKSIGPISTAPGTPGVRPFTINQGETLAYITATGLLGFQVGDIASGKMLYTVPVKGFSWDSSGSGVTAPSHGISLSPDDKELYVMDGPNSFVHVYDVRGLPSSAPTQVADIPLQNKVQGMDMGCVYDCRKDGWLQHSRDGRFVFVGDSGDVIDTAARKTVATLPAATNSPVFIEIDFQGGVPVWAMQNRNFVGNLPDALVPAGSDRGVRGNPSGVAVVQSAAARGSAVPVVAASFPASNTAGNLILAFVRMSTTTQTVTVNDANGNAYVDAVSQVQDADGHQVHLFYAKNIRGGSNTVTASFSAMNAHPWMEVYEYSGLSTTDPLDQTASAQGSDASPNTGTTAATRNAKELLFTGFGLPASFGGSVYAGAGFILGTQDAGNLHGAVESAMVFSSGVYGGTLVLSTPASWTGIIASFK